MGRKPKDLNDEQRAQVEALAAYLTQEQIADYFGIGKTTWFAMLERDPDISERYKRGKARAVGAVAQNLIKKAREGDNACMMFYLKTQAGWRETQHVEMTGKDGGPVQTETTVSDDLRAALDAIAGKIASGGSAG